jgi:hypothetical protein
VTRGRPSFDDVRLRLSGGTGRRLGRPRAAAPGRRRRSHRRPPRLRRRPPPPRARLGPVHLSCARCTRAPSTPLCPCGSDGRSDASSLTPMRGSARRSKHSEPLPGTSVAVSDAMTPLGALLPKVVDDGAVRVTSRSPERLTLDHGGEPPEYEQDHHDARELDPSERSAPGGARFSSGRSAAPPAWRHERGRGADRSPAIPDTGRLAQRRLFAEDPGHAHRYALTPAACPGNHAERA